MERVEIAPGHAVSRVIRGGWQLAGGHGAVDAAASVEDLIAFADAGITTFDCADIYSGVEEMTGAFRREYGQRRGAAALERIRVHTKYVPDLDALPRLTRSDVALGIETSLRRLGTGRLDLVQLHWWDYAADRYVETALHLADLRREGKIAGIGGTNFDTAATLRMIEAGVPIVSMQVQYSLLDDRPARSLAEAASAHGFHLLAYGTVAGGLLSERWLGAAEPRPPFENRSLAKYKLVADEAGGWDAVQSLLAALAEVAARHGSDIATVASRAVLGRPGVAAVIVGARNRAHLPRNLAIAALPLDAADLARIEAARAGLRPVPGEVYALERDRSGPHGAIMKYNLNRGAA